MITKHLLVHKYTALALLAGYLLILTILSVFSFGTIESIGSEYDDKLHHFIAHAVLVILAFNFLDKIRISKVIVASVLLSMVYGIIIEIVQLTIATSRTFDLVDLLANFLGALSAIVLLKLWEYHKIN